MLTILFGIWFLIALLMVPIAFIKVFFIDP